MKSDSYGRLIAGPVGSGKTVCCIMELLRRAIMQEPAPDGVRYTRFAVVRQTLKQLKDTILKDCDDWLGANGLGQWKVSESTYHVNFDDVRSEWVFIPLENAEDQARLLSMQLTGAWLSECIEMDLGVLGPISGRIGRYPAGARGQPSWFGWIADTNFPTLMTPWYNFMERPGPDTHIFKQPGGMTPLAENLNHLVQTNQTKALPVDHPVRIAQGRKYYERLLSVNSHDPAWCDRYVHALYGDDPSGMAVFKNTFRPNFHIVQETMLIPGYPLLIGQDFGRNPWSIICQPDHLGRLVVHQEVPAKNVGLEKHVAQSLKPLLFSDRYIGFRLAVIGDPAGIAKGSIAEESCFDALQRLGFAAFPAPTNDIEARLRAVEALLARQTNGGPTLLINATGAPFLARAMSGGYRFKKTLGGALKPKPDKDDPEGFSHVADCLQYVCLVMHGGMMEWVTQRLNPHRLAPQPKISALAWT